jgi:hypothetical protein
VDSFTTWPGRSGYWATHSTGVVVHAETTAALDEAMVGLDKILGGSQ